VKKLLTLLTLLLCGQLYSQEYPHFKLQELVGYTALSEHPEINRKQIEFLTYYTNRKGPWFEEVNQYMRTGNWFGWNHHEIDMGIEQVDTLLNVSPALPSDIILFRGQSMMWLGRHFSIDEEFTDGAYFSTSTDLKTARFYAGESTLSFTMVLYFKNSKNNHQGLVLNNSDKEVLLPKYKTYKVMDSFKGVSTRYGLVQVCSDDGCDKRVRTKGIKKWWKKFKESNVSYK
jgi:hypothetical protein